MQSNGVGPGVPHSLPLNLVTIHNIINKKYMEEIGTRPASYFSLIPEDVHKARIKLLRSKSLMGSLGGIRGGKNLGSLGGTRPDIRLPHKTPRNTFVARVARKSSAYDPRQGFPSRPFMPPRQPWFPYGLFSY